jgi:hypothetical protein
MRLHDGHLRRESEGGQQIADRARSHRDAEGMPNQIGNDFRCPTFGGIASGDGTAENNLFELLFLLLTESGDSS